MPNWVSNKLIISNSSKLIKKIKEHSKLNETNRPGFMASFFKNHNPNDVNWYDSNIQNFGTKWDIFEYQLTSLNNSLIIEFQTAWSPPISFINHIQTIYKKASIILEYLGEGSEFAGIYNQNDSSSRIEYDPYKMSPKDIRDDETMPEWIKIESYNCSLYNSKSKSEFKKNFFLIPTSIRYTSVFLNDVLCNFEDNLHKDCLKDIFNNLNTINDSNILYLLLKKPFLTKSELSKLYTSNDLNVLVALCSNNSVTEEFLNNTYLTINKTKNKTLILEMMENLATNKNCPSHFFEKFDLKTVFYQLSLNPKTPINILHSILKDEEANSNRKYLIERIKEHPNYKNLAKQLLITIDSKNTSK